MIPYIYTLNKTTRGSFFSLLTWSNQISGQIIATSHDLTPNGGLVEKSPYFRKKYYNLARNMFAGYLLDKST